MEHTQGKVKIVYKPLNPAYIHIGVHKIAQMSSTGTLSREQQDANAERIKTCLLEYDTLKAKAELFDEMLSAIRLTYHDLYDDCTTVAKFSAARKATKAIYDKTKEL